ncbi:hypothetical protein OS242_02830 [Tumebacillus sp. DT12]|uniref:Tetratricopeptide repeat protein n=1 Tax=Tumebacillus lacus TaxID=2995335 RepID=A0ABT3WW37_9BACL|nr:hypothetical protein [Tumebacillus lacus]MCX7568895.1 hypothetical protein [Tumebacillus lacus]
MSVQSTWSLVAVGLLSLWVYRSFFKPPARYQDLTRQAAFYQLLRQRDKALAVWRAGLQLPSLTEVQRAGIWLEVGGLLAQCGQHQEAAVAFGQAFDLIGEQQFRYDAKLMTAVRAFVQTGQHEKAQALYDQLLSRAEYDRQFLRLREIENLLKK